MTTHPRQFIFIAVGLSASLVLVIVAALVASNRLSLFGKAASTRETVAISKENSYIFASPITSIADGSSAIRVTVVLLNNQGFGAANQTVSLKVTNPVSVKPISPTTDNFGRATFDVTSQTPGNYTISAVSGDVTLPQTVSISFH